LEGAERHPQKVEAAAHGKGGRKKEGGKNVVPLSAEGKTARTELDMRDVPDTATALKHDAREATEVGKLTELRDRGKAARALCDRQVGRRDVSKIVDFIKNQIKPGR
jgi:hypothetical protein